MDIIKRNQILNEAVNNLINEYSKVKIDITPHIPRSIFEVNLILNNSNHFNKVIDLGGGISIFSILLKSFYDEVYVIDDFLSCKNLDEWQKFTFDLMMKKGVKTINKNLEDVDNLDVNFKNTSILCTFNFIEHLHSSPKRLLNKCLSEANYQCSICIGTPNSNNIRKRFSAIFGNYTWSDFNQYWDEYPFRGHVREPSVSDLNQIVLKLGYLKYQNFGRNWLGLYGNNNFVKFLTRIFDSILRFFPSLCSDIYVVAKKNNI